MNEADHLSTPAMTQVFQLEGGLPMSFEAVLDKHSEQTQEATTTHRRYERWLCCPEIWKQVESSGGEVTQNCDRAGRAVATTQTSLVPPHRLCLQHTIWTTLWLEKNKIVMAFLSKGNH